MVVSHPRPPHFQHFGVGSIPWSPLARGALTRPLGERTIRADNDGCVIYFLESAQRKKFFYLHLTFRWYDGYLKEPANQEVVKR